MKPFFSLLVLSAFTLSALADLQCTPIPHTNEALCYKEEDSDVPPMIHWTLYHQDANKQLHELDHARHTPTIPGGFIFSPSGKYLLQEFTEEGHPMFTLYLSKDFIHDAKTSALGGFEEYEMAELIGLSDEAVLHYRLVENGCEKSKEGCERILDLLDQAHK